ncbi:MAG: GntR family transcriptional regulator [Burkholderiales bacterium]|nr:GntR family transcriptional regulator [Burkholderiales bacterium]
MSPLHSALPLPKYHQVYLVLREQLQEGRFAAGLPGELALAGQFDVARATVRRALAQLASEGLIARAPGRDTVPTPRRAAHGADASKGRGGALSGLLGDIVSMGLATKVQVIDCDVRPASDTVAQALRLAPGTPVQKALRLRSTREGPLSLITTHVPADLARGFGRRELAKKPILILLEESGVRIDRATQTLSACQADASAARHLGLQVGSALLTVKRLVLDEAGRPVQLLHGLYRPDRYQYEMQLSRVDSVDTKVWVSSELAAPFH